MKNLAIRFAHNRAFPSSGFVRSIQMLQNLIKGAIQTLYNALGVGVWSFVLRTATKISGVGVIALLLCNLDSFEMYLFLQLHQGSPLF